MKRVSEPVAVTKHTTQASSLSPSMLSSHGDVRGQMIILKKIIIPSTRDKIRDLLVSSLKKGVWIAFGGIDGLNMQFANKSVHIGHIELVLIPDESQSEHHYDEVMQNLINHLTEEYNEVLGMLANSENAPKTHDLMKVTDPACQNDGKFFVAQEFENRSTINYRCVSMGTSIEQPVVEIRVLKHEKLKPLKKYSLYHLTLSQIWRDVQVNLGTFGEHDWSHRNANLTHALHRDDLTFAFETIQSIMKVCFPAITVKESMSRQAGLDLFTKTLEVAPATFSAEQQTLLKIVKSEIDGESDSIIKRATFEEFMKRGQVLGILPPDDGFLRCIDNVFNRNLLSQIRNKVAAD